MLLNDAPGRRRVRLRCLRNLPSDAGAEKPRISVGVFHVEAHTVVAHENDRPIFTVHSSHPRLVLLDLKLPKVDGLQVLREIKGTPEIRMIPVVVMTSSGEERDIVESYKLGVNRYIQKPVDFE
jgi:CheY-like chemotaxis protein